MTFLALSCGLAQQLTPRANRPAHSAILLCYFLIPRTPTITFNSPKIPDPALTSDDPSPYVSSADPTGFSFGANLTLASESAFPFSAVRLNASRMYVRHLRG